MRTISREQFRDELVPVARKLLESLGIEPYSQYGSTKHSWKQFIVAEIDGLHENNRQVFCRAGGCRAAFRVVSAWGSGDPRISWTGRTMRLGQLVWVHSRQHPEYPIIAKAAILQICDDDRMRRYRRRSYVYSGSDATYLVSEGFTDLTKVSKIEPVKDKDRGKSALEMQAEREDEKRQSLEAEELGHTTMRLVAEEVSVVRLKVQIHGATEEWLAEHYRLWAEFVKQLEADAGKPIKEMTISTVLTLDALEKYNGWKAHCPL